MDYYYSLCLVEDNQTLWSLIHQWLMEEGFECTWYTSAEDVKDIEKYDCFLLDVMLPWQDWYSLWAHIRKQSNAGIIFLTAKWQLQDKSQWFEAWGDDYLVKPFAMQELTMRIDALLERIPNQSVYIAEDIVINFDKRTVSKKNNVIHLTPIERKVLETLHNNVWIPCSRVVLVEAWRGHEDLFSMSRSLDVTIANLRSKLGKTCIITISKIGYQLNDS